VKNRKSWSKFEFERWTITTVKKYMWLQKSQANNYKNMFIMLQNSELLQWKEANAIIKKVWHLFHSTKVVRNELFFFSPNSYCKPIKPQIICNPIQSEKCVHCAAKFRVVAIRRRKCNKIKKVSGTCCNK
jgi:hypothetical protein